MTPVQGPYHLRRGDRRTFQPPEEAGEPGTDKPDVLFHR